MMVEPIPNMNGTRHQGGNCDVNGNSARVRPLDILIVGAGLGGLAAAISCSLAGHKVTVLEAAPSLGEVGAGIQLSPNITRLFRSWGLFPLLSSKAVEPHNIWMRRWETGEPISVTRLSPDFVQNFGAPYWVVHRAHLHEALVIRAKDLGAQIVLDARVASCDFDTPSVKTHTGSVYRADLVIGCDGLKSVTRAHLLGGVDAGPQTSPFCAYRSTVPMKLLRDDPELVDLIQQPDLSLWVGENRHVMSYPISGGETFNMVLSHPDEGNDSAFLASQEDLLKEMKGHYQGWDPRLLKIIGLIDRTAKWKLMTYPRLESWRAPSGKFVLTGDACHAMLPYMSQGAAQAIEDAAVLSRCLARCASAEAVPKFTQAYEEIRKDRAYRVQYLSSLNGRIWHYPDGPDQQRRDEGMAATLTGQHYIRSTNQWSDPSTQVWLYGHDAEEDADRQLDGRLRADQKSTRAVKGVLEMSAAGLLADY